MSENKGRAMKSFDRADADWVEVAFDTQKRAQRVTLLARKRDTQLLAF